MHASLCIWKKKNFLLKLEYADCDLNNMCKILVHLCACEKERDDIHTSFYVFKCVFMFCM